jgi:hypothetical protein
MIEAYEFDPCSIDGSDKPDVVTIDNWKPAEKKDKFRARSDWRKESNKIGGKNDIGRNDLQKIKAYIKNDVSDASIKKTFNITSEVLYAIRKNKFCVIEGIIEDDIDVLKREMKAVKTKLDSLKIDIGLMAQVLLTDKALMKAFSDIKKQHAEELKEKDRIKKAKEKEARERRKLEGDDDDE